MVTAVAIALNVAILVAVVAVAVSRRRGPRTVGLPAAAGTGASRPDVLTRMVVGLRNRRWARVSLSLLSVALLAGGVGMIGYPFYTNLYQSRVQSQLDRQFASPEIEQAYRAGAVAEGDSLTRIKIPAINVDVMVVAGTSASALRAGAGHYPETPLPCEDGNVGIAGHRTTYGRPFANLDLLKPGDDIILETPIGSCRYKVAKRPFIVAPTDTWVVDPTPEAMLTLTTCHPKHSAAQRLIVQAQLVPGDGSLS
jgi:sortase A